MSRECSSCGSVMEQVEIAQIGGWFEACVENPRHTVGENFIRFMKSGKWRPMLTVHRGRQSGKVKQAEGKDDLAPWER